MGTMAHPLPSSLHHWRLGHRHIAGPAVLIFVIVAGCGGGYSIVKMGNEHQKHPRCVILEFGREE